MESIATCPYFRKELKSKNFVKIIYFPLLKETIFFRPIGVFTSLDVTISRVTLHERAQIFLKKARM